MHRLNWDMGLLCEALKLLLLMTLTQSSLSLIPLPSRLQNGGQEVRMLMGEEFCETIMDTGTSRRWTGADNSVIGTKVFSSSALVTENLCVGLGIYCR